MTRPLTAPGRLVCGRYRLHQQIGGGGMGAVWLARDELLGRQVAVKQILPPTGADPDAVDQLRQRALREGRIAARLSHQHAIAVYDVAVEGGQPWLVMEYLPSRSLAAVLAEDGVLRVDQVAQIGAQVADALAATHAAGIVHRDVKPGNILIGRGGRVEGLVKITDFGISHASGDVTLTQTGQITGTPAFLAPEVAQGHEMSQASDVFSLGATLYTCLEGSPPFGMDDNALRLLHRVAGGVIRPPLRAGSLTAALRRMLAADPAARPSMAEVRDDLASLAAGRDGDTTDVLKARADLRPSAPARMRTTEFAENRAEADAASVAAVAAPVAEPEPAAAEPEPAAAEPEKPAAAEPAARPAARPARTLVTPSGEPADGAASRTPPPVTAPPSAPSPPARVSAPVEPPHHEVRPDRRRRPAWLWVVAAVVAVLLVGLIVFWVAALDDTSAGDGGSPAATASRPGTEAQNSGGAAAQTNEQTSEAAPSSEESSAASSSNGDPLSAASITDFLQSYHEQVISDPAAAWQRTGPTLRAAIGSEQAYIDYWGQFSDVVVSDIQASDGNNVATATLQLRYPNGQSETGSHRFTFLVQDGQLILDSDYPA